MANTKIIATPFTTTLATYVSNIFYGVFIQDDDDIAQTVYTRNWSPDVQENDNGNPLNFTQFRNLLVQTRAAITNRQLISQSAVVAPADKVGRTGQVAHTTHWTGVQDGKNVRGTIVSVLKVGFQPQPGKDEGRRIVQTESFVLSVVPDLTIHGQ